MQKINILMIFNIKTKIVYIIFENNCQIYLNYF